MITIIGTIHVVNIAEPIMFIIKQIWPQAVLVELDVGRYSYLTSGDADKQKSDNDWIISHAAEYQRKLAEARNTTVGNEMLTAVQTGRLVGAEIGFIDDDAAAAMERAWKEMPFGEKFRYFLSAIRDRFKGKKDVQRLIDDSKFADEAMKDMRRKYPTIVRVLVDERNAKMAEQIKTYSEKYDNIVVVVGDAHVEGLAELLSDRELRKIRLADILDKERLDKVRASLWNRSAEDEG